MDDKFPRRYGMQIKFVDGAGNSTTKTISGLNLPNDDSEDAEETRQGILQTLATVINDMTMNTLTGITLIRYEGVELP